MREDFVELWEVYNFRFGATFSYFDVVRSNDLIEKAIPLMQAAIDGKRDVIKDKDLFDLPDGAFS